MSGDNINFWSNEWRKHGTCTVLSQYDYFKTALDLHGKVNLLEVLKDSGIEPNGDKFYSLETIKSAIKKGFGYYAIIQCNVDKAKNQQLQEVYLCVWIKRRPISSIVLLFMMENAIHKFKPPFNNSPPVSDN